MSRLLAELLYEPEVLVESAISKLEHLCGWESTDVRLLAEINNKVRNNLADLNLDPDDTTGEELYHALQVKVQQDTQNLNLTTDEVIEKLKQVHRNYQVYALKHSVAKDLLRKHPPRKLMKQLNYRSVDSMLKRENVCELYAVLMQIESSRWLNVFWKDLSKVTPSDFETQNIEIAKLSYERWKTLDTTTLSPIPLVGAVAYWASQTNLMNLSLNIASDINKLRGVSAQIKLRNVEPSFGKSLVEIISNNSSHPLKVSHLPISWHAVFHHYGTRSVKEHTEFFGPHMLHEDIKSHNAIELLSKISPVFSWWQGLEYVGSVTEQGLVSFNLLDITNSQGKKFKERDLSSFRQALWHEFINRYFEHPSVEQHFMQQLEPQTIPIEDLQPNFAPERSIRQMIEAGI